MNKNNKLLLNDYLKDSTDLRLSLFATMLNPLFKLDRKVKEQLIKLIEDYSLDQSRMRLNLIESFIGASSQDKGLFKPKQIKTKEVILKQQEMSKDNKEMNDLRTQILSLIRMRQPGLANVMLENQINDLKSKLHLFESAAGMYDACPPEKSKLDVIFGIFGHWDDPESLSYEFIHGHRQVIQIRSNQDVKQAMLDLIVLSGQQLRQFHIANNEMAGGVKGVAHMPTWTLTDVSSGIIPKNNNFITMVDGKISDLDIGRYVPQPKLTGASWNQK